MFNLWTELKSHGHVCICCFMFLCGHELKTSFHQHHWLWSTRQRHQHQRPSCSTAGAVRLTLTTTWQLQYIYEGKLRFGCVFPCPPDTESWHWSGIQTRTQTTKKKQRGSSKSCRRPMKFSQMVRVLFSFLFFFTLFIFLKALKLHWSV